MNAEHPLSKPISVASVRLLIVKGSADSLSGVSGGKIVSLWYRNVFLRSVGPNQFGFSATTPALDLDRQTSSRIMPCSPSASCHGPLSNRTPSNPNSTRRLRYNSGFSQAASKAQ